jgi:hypothetical protein
MIPTNIQNLGDHNVDNSLDNARDLRYVIDSKNRFVNCEVSVERKNRR